MAKMLVTGAGGFAGQALCAALQAQDIDFIPIVRARLPSLPQARIVKDINPSTAWLGCLTDVGVVVHLAARVHVLNDASIDPLRDYRLGNVEATLHLARQCVKAGVRRFIYLSSVKVNGESTTTRPFFADDAPAPLDPYGISKFEAEQGLRKLALESGLELVIIRPPLVYGPRVKANFLALMHAVKRGVPLPLASVRENRRSMIYLGNLLDLILRCSVDDAAIGQIFLASDGHDVSTAGLIAAIAGAMGKRPRLFPTPPLLLMGAAALLGKRATAERLCGSLQVDIEHTRQVLAWTPPHSFEAGIEQTVRHFLEAHGSFR